VIGIFPEENVGHGARGEKAGSASCCWRLSARLLLASATSSSGNDAFWRMSASTAIAGSALAARTVVETSMESFSGIGAEVTAGALKIFGNLLCISRLGSLSMVLGEQFRNSRAIGWVGGKTPRTETL